MAYTLGSITLPRPTDFTRKPKFIGRMNDTLDGTTKQDVIRQKEIYIMSFKFLTQAQVAEILSEYNTAEARNFAVSDGSLTITSRSVLIRISDRQYSAKSADYLEDITLELTEV